VIKQFLGLDFTRGGQRRLVELTVLADRKEQERGANNTVPFVTEFTCTHDQHVQSKSFQQLQELK
jgi:hypothetical protein